MTSAKYIGLDVHQATIAAAALSANGKLVMESILETRASTILDFIRGVRGELSITFEEGVCVALVAATSPRSSARLLHRAAGCARANHAQAEDRAIAIGRPPGGCAVEVPVTALHQPPERVGAVRVVEAMQHGQRARRGDCEDRATA